MSRNTPSARRAREERKARADREMWFMPKIFGYGAGLPIAWQGWAVYATFIVFAVAVGEGLLEGTPEMRAIGIVVLIAGVVVLIGVSKARTRGGWKWRWGQRD